MGRTKGIYCIESFESIQLEFSSQVQDIELELELEMGDSYISKYL